MSLVSGTEVLKQQAVPAKKRQETRGVVMAPFTLPLTCTTRMELN